MAELFWQRSLTTIDYDTLITFIEERIQEGDHLEYKLPTYNKSHGKFEFTGEFLETVVAFANAGGGLIIYGVGEEKDEEGNTYPASVQGVRTTAPKGEVRNPEGVLRDTCATMIDPLVSLDTRAIPIKTGEYAGNVILLARVRRGLLPPYNLRLRRGQGIFIRNGERDATASVREIIELIGRRDASTRHEDTPWERIGSSTFAYTSQDDQRLPPILMIGLTPAFPIPPIPIDNQSDRGFQNICLSLYGQEYYPVMQPDGITYSVGAHKPMAPAAPVVTAHAYADGSIGVRDSDEIFSSWRWGEEVRASPYEVDLPHLWRRIALLLTQAQRWPRDVCGYDGPLVCRLALGNIANAIATIPDEWWSRSTAIRPRQIVPNPSRGWSIDTEWDQGMSVKDVIERSLPPLARQLQFGHYHAFKNKIMEAIEHL